MKKHFGERLHSSLISMEQIHLIEKQPPIMFEDLKEHKQPKVWSNLELVTILILILNKFRTYHFIAKKIIST